MKEDMKTFEECQQWLRQHGVLNQLYRDFHNREHDWHPEYHSIRGVYETRGNNLINTSFEWCRTPEEAHRGNFWLQIHREFINWF